MKKAGIVNALTAAPETVTFDFGPAWHITARSGKILSSVGVEREKLEGEFAAIPEMFFAENLLELNYRIGNENTALAGIRFTAADALKCVKAEPPSDIKVSAAEVWRTSREKQIAELAQNNPIAEKVNKGFDWTYNTDYKGSLFTENSATISVEPTQDDLDWSNLQRRDEPIVFSANVPFYEDELADSGCAQLLGRIRVMPSGFFLLLRYFLRVDGVKFVSNETRVRFVSPSSAFPPSSINFLRTFVSKEGSYSSVCARLGSQGSVLDADQVAAILDPVLEVRERVHFHLAQ